MTRQKITKIAGISNRLPVTASVIGVVPSLTLRGQLPAVQDKQERTGSWI